MMSAFSPDLLFVVSLAVIWLVLLYHTLLSYAGHRLAISSELRRQKLDDTPHGELPFVSILIPAHNEERVIEKTIRAIGGMDYPRDRMEVLCLNDGSTDRTGLLASREAQRVGPHVRVVNVPRDRGGRGKSAVLNYGLTRARGEVIAVYDADNTPARSALMYLVRTLLEGREKKVGAVIGKFRTRNRQTNLLTRFINLETLFFQWTTQAGRRQLYGMATIPGTNFVIWRELLGRLGGWDEGALTEDTELSIRIYREGHWVDMAPYAVTWEEEPDRWRTWFKQRTRWARGNIYVIAKYFFPLLLQGRIRLFLDVAYLVGIYFLFLTSLTTSLAIFLTGLAGLTRLHIEGPFNILWGMAAVLFILEMAICLTTEPGEDRKDNLFLALLMYFSYSQMWLLVMLNAFWQELLSLFGMQKTFWHKTERTG